MKNTVFDVKNNVTTYEELKKTPHFKRFVFDSFVSKIFMILIIGGAILFYLYTNNGMNKETIYSIAIMAFVVIFGIQGISLLQFSIRKEEIVKNYYEEKQKVDEINI